MSPIHARSNTRDADGHSDYFVFITELSPSSYGTATQMTSKSSMHKGFKPRYSEDCEVQA